MGLGYIHSNLATSLLQRFLKGSTAVDFNCSLQGGFERVLWVVL